MEPNMELVHTTLPSRPELTWRVKHLTDRAAHVPQDPLISIPHLWRQLFFKTINGLYLLLQQLFTLRCSLYKIGKLMWCDLLTQFSPLSSSHYRLLGVYSSPSPILFFLQGPKETHTLNRSCALTKTQGHCTSALGSGVQVLIIISQLDPFWVLVLKTKGEDRERHQQQRWHSTEFSMSHCACFCDKIRDTGLYHQKSTFSVT